MRDPILLLDARTLDPAAVQLAATAVRTTSRRRPRLQRERQRSGSHDPPTRATGRLLVAGRDGAARVGAGGRRHGVARDASEAAVARGRVCPLEQGGAQPGRSDGLREPAAVGVRRRQRPSALLARARRRQLSASATPPATSSSSTRRAGSWPPPRHRTVSSCSTPPRGGSGTCSAATTTGSGRSSSPMTGGRLASSSWDRTGIIWDVATGGVRERLRLGEGAVAIVVRPR